MREKKRKKNEWQFVDKWRRQTDAVEIQKMRKRNHRKMKDEKMTNQQKAKA